MAARKTTTKSAKLSFNKPVIPVLWDVPASSELLANANAIFLQGGSISDLREALHPLEHPTLRNIPVFLNLDLLAGLSTDEAALKYIANYPRVGGIITTRHQLAKTAHRLGLAAIVRVFLQDSRALERGIHIAKNIKPDALEILPGVAGAHVASEFLNLNIPILAGGLIRSAETVETIINAGISAVSTSKPELWQLNNMM